MKPVVVVGAGPSGLLQALYLAKRGRPVTVIEQQPVLGGMFAGALTPWGLVDQGIHIIQETGDPAWDELFAEILPPAEWSVFVGPARDVAGNVFAGSFDGGSMFPDLRRLPRVDYDRCVAEMTARLGDVAATIATASNLGDYLERRFGPHAVQLVFEPIARKIWRRPLAQIHPAAARIVYLARVVIGDRDETLARKRSSGWDERLAFPDQRDVPPTLAAGWTPTRYPKQYGMWRVVDGLRAALERCGAELLPATRIRAAEVVGRRVDALQLATGGRDRRLEAGAVVWTTPPSELLRLLGVAASAPPDPPLPHRVVWLLLDRPPRSGDVHWLRSYDAGDPVIRMSNPAAYCPDSSAAGRPVCVELHVDDPQTPDDRAAEAAESSLRALGLISGETRVRAAAVLPGSRNFFVPTLANCAALGADRDALADVRPDNVVVSTQDIGAAVFYLPEILIAGTEKLLAL